MQVSTKKEKQPEVIGLIGVGLDGKDGHQRITRNEDFLLVGGSEQTHEQLQEVSIKFNEGLQKRGQPLRETPVEVVIDLLNKARDP